MNTFKQLFNDMDKEIAIVVDNMLKNSPPPPHHSSQSPEPIKQEARTILHELLSGKDLRDRIESGFQIIFRELAIHENPLLVNDIRDEWKKCTEILTQNIHNVQKETQSTQPTPAAEQTIPPSFQEIFPVSDTTLAHFYQCGSRLHQQGNYQEAADAFFIVTILDYRRHNAWLAMGLAEKALEHWAIALVAFSMAALTNMQSPISFLHSTECHLALGEKADAESSLRTAAELTQHLPDDQARQMNVYIAGLKKSLS